MKTKHQALRDLSRVIADAAEQFAGLTPRQAAVRAWHPGGPPLEELERQIAADEARLAA